MKYSYIIIPPSSSTPVLILISSYILCLSCQCYICPFRNQASTQIRSFEATVASAFEIHYSSMTNTIDFIVFLIFLLLFCLSSMLARVGAHVLVTVSDATTHVWRSENKFCEFFISFSSSIMQGLGNQTQVPRPFSLAQPFHFGSYTVSRMKVTFSIQPAISIIHNF